MASIWSWRQLMGTWDIYSCSPAGKKMSSSPLRQAWSRTIQRTLFERAKKFQKPNFPGLDLRIHHSYFTALNTLLRIVLLVRDLPSHTFSIPRDCLMDCTCLIANQSYCCLIFTHSFVLPVPDYSSLSVV